MLCGGFLVAFLSGKGAGRKEEKISKLDETLKSVKKDLKVKEKSKSSVKKTLKSKKKALEDIKKQKNKKIKDVGTSAAADFLKKYAKKKT